MSTVIDLLHISDDITQLQDELATIDERFEAGEFEDIAGEEKRIVEAYSDLCDHIEENVDDITYSVMMQKAKISVMDQTIKRAQGRKKTAEKGLDRFKNLIRGFMELRNISKIRGAAHTMYLTHSVGTEYEGDPEKLPEAMLEHHPSRQTRPGLPRLAPC